MKKLIVFSITALFSLTMLMAQDINFGVKGGVNFATVTGDDNFDWKTKTAFHAGVMVEIPISDNFSIQPEFMYSAQGSKYEESYSEDGFTVNEEVELKLDYLNLPIMAKFYPGEGFSIEAGPQIGFLLSSEVEWEASFNGQSESDTEDIKDETKGIDFGINLGLGYKMDNGLNIGARYNIGLVNIVDEKSGENDEITDLKNSVIQISIGFFF